MTRITRVEVIDENGRSYVNLEDDNDVSYQLQDDGKTLKVFVNKVKSRTGEEEALEALDKFQNDWLLGKKCPETKLEIKNLNSVEAIEAEIKLLQSKLEFYKELDNQTQTLFDAIRNLGYSIDCCDEIVDAVEAFQKSKENEQVSFVPKEIKELVKESVKWCEEHQNERVEDWLKPQLKEEDNDKNFKNSLDLIKEWGEKNKPLTLYQLIENWWCDVFCANSTDDMETCIDSLVDIIDGKFIPPSHDTNDYQWNQCLKMMREKLR